MGHVRHCKTLQNEVHTKPAATRHMSDVSHRYAACVQHESPLRGTCATQAAAAPLRGILLCCYSHLTCQAPKHHSLCTPRRGSQRPRDRQRSWIQTNPETLTTSSRPGSGGTWRCALVLLQWRRVAPASCTWGCRSGRQCREHSRCHAPTSGCRRRTHTETM